MTQQAASGARAGADALSRAGLAQLALSVALLSSAFPATKVALSLGAGPLWFALGRAGLAWVAGGVVLAAMGRLHLPVRADLPAILAVGLLSLAGFFALTHVALAHIPAGRSSVLSNATTIWIAPLTVLVLREPVPPRRWLGAALAMAGVVVLAGPWAIDWGSRAVLVGHACLLGASLGFALAMLVLRRLPPGSAMLDLLPWCFGLATIALGAIVALDGEAPGVWPPGAMAAMAYIGLVAAPIGTLCVMLASAALPAMVASVGFLATPAIGLALSTALLGEALGWDLIVGAVLILAGVALAAVPDRRRA